MSINVNDDAVHLRITERFSLRRTIGKNRYIRDSHRHECTYSMAMLQRDKTALVGHLQGKREL